MPSAPEWLQCEVNEMTPLGFQDRGLTSTWEISEAKQRVGKAQEDVQNSAL